MPATHYASTTAPVEDSFAAPANIHAETTILGAILLDNNAWSEVAEKLGAGDFALDSHQRIFSAIQKMFAVGRTVDLVTLGEQMRNCRELEAVGGLAFLASLTDGLPRQPAISEYIRIVREKSGLRQLAELGQKTMNAAYGQAHAVDEVLERTEQMLLGISDRSIANSPESFGTWLAREHETIDSFYKQNAVKQGIGSGITELDQMTCGFQKGELIIVAARPSMGKTAAGLGFALNASVKDSKRALFFSLEMGKKAIFDRAIANLGCISLEDIRKSRWTELTRRYANEAMAVLADAAFAVDDEGGLTVQRIKAKAMRVRQQLGGLDLVVIDQLNHIVVSGEVSKLNRDCQLGAITRELKAMAKALDSPVVLLHQLNREVEHSDSKEPRLYHLRDSGNIEQDADVVIFPHRPGYYNPKRTSETDAGFEGNSDREAFMIIAKQRNGPIGRARCEFIADEVKFQDPYEG